VDKKEIFLAAIKENEGLIFKIASVYTNNLEDKKDLVQEIIYQLWKSFDTFSQKSSLSTWMYRVALNVSIHLLKVSKRSISKVPIEGQILAYDEEDNKALEQKWEVFRKQIENLNLLDKAILMLYLDKKSYDEIAEVVGITASNVGTKLLRIKEILKSKIIKQP